jgi:ABC-type nickel/cobalt efflux system permease component RcnA
MNAHDHREAHIESDSSMSSRRVPAQLLWMLMLGFCIWCSALVVVYVLHATGCTFAWSTATLRLSLGLAILAALAMIGWLWRNYAKTGPDPALGSTGSFLHWVILWTLIAAFVTVIFTLGPTLLLTTCA